MKEEKITSNNAISYLGKVTVKLLKGRKSYRTIKIKNEGSNKFFQILCNAVIGNNYQSQMPSCIGVFASNDAELTAVRVHYTTASVSEKLNNWFAEFTFIIPGTMVLPGTVSKLKLYNSVNEQAEVLATVELQNDETFELAPGSNLMITWNLSFQNVEV